MTKTEAGSLQALQTSHDRKKGPSEGRRCLGSGVPGGQDRDEDDSEEDDEELPPSIQPRF